MKAIDAKHGKFDVVICVGDFFADPASEDAELNALLDGKLEGIEINFYTSSNSADMNFARSQCLSQLMLCKGDVLFQTVC